MKEETIRKVISKLGLSTSFYDDFSERVFVPTRLLQIPTGSGTNIGRENIPLAR
jgi:hypothetical protein